MVVRCFWRIYMPPVVIFGYVVVAIVLSMYLPKWMINHSGEQALRESREAKAKLKDKS